MIPFTLYLLAAFGVAFGVGHSELTYEFRKSLSKSNVLAQWFLKLLECPACVGWHCGWVWIAIGGVHFFGMSSTWHEALLLGFATCGSNLLLAKFAGLTDPA